MRSGKLPRPGKHTPVHHQQVEEITHWHGSAEAVGKVTNQAGTHCDHRDGHRNRELSPRPDRIGENAPGAELRGHVFEQDECGRDDRTRTCDLLLPKQAR